MDLLIEKHGKVIGAYEIKAVAHVGGNHLSGLRAFRQGHTDVPLHIISLVENAYRIGDILVMPWKMYLEDLSEHLG